MGGAVSSGVHNDDLVDNLKNADYIRTPSVERVLRAVDRADYMLPESRFQAYRDMAWKMDNLHLSAPCIYAQVLEGLQLAPGDYFLNIGSGTGYLSTMAGLVVGDRGVNHGVELHANVVTYAYDHLEEFKNESPLLDYFNFCEPEFVQGNGLCLSTDCTQYDKVYCGATCPTSWESYMKNLIKIGGILVMPVKDKLFKITRTGDDTWNTKYLLSVSFSNLILPDADHPPSTVYLPELHPPKLQEMCREQIRSLLREQVNEEHPNLTKLPDTSPPPRESRKRGIKKRFRSPHSFSVYHQPVYYQAFDYRPSEDFPNIVNDQSDEEETSDEDDASPSLNQILQDYTSAVDHSSFIGDLHLSLPEESDSNVDNENIPSSIPRKCSVPELIFDGNSNDSDESETALGLGSSEISDNKFSKSTPEKEEHIDDIDEDDAKPSSIKTPDEKPNISSAGDDSGLSNRSSIPAEASGVIRVFTRDIAGIIASGWTEESPRKREKFDSGLGEDGENCRCSGVNSSTSTSRTFSYEEEDDDEAGMDVDSDYGGSLPRQACPVFPYLIDPNERTCPCSASCKDTDEKCACNNSKKRETNFHIYSKFMQEKVNQLPLPPAIKTYVNLNRKL